MWYKYCQLNLDEIDEIADKVKGMNPYSIENHMQLLKKPKIPKELLPDSIEDRLNILEDNTSKFRDYLSIYPQIYLYPSSKEQVWKYEYFDPKSLKRLYNPDYYENLSTNISINEPVEKAIEYCHKKIPGSMIDYYNNEEEFLKDQ